MKTYNKLITEISNPFAGFRKTFRNIERVFPGVSQFLSIANRYVLRGNRYQNTDLKRLLKRLKKRPDISDMSKRDLKYVYDFINKYNLTDIESMRSIFDSYSDFTRDQKQITHNPEVNNSYE
jgi:hypothetical protein